MTVIAAVDVSLVTDPVEETYSSTGTTQASRRMRVSFEGTKASGQADSDPNVEERVTLEYVRTVSDQESAGYSQDPESLDPEPPLRGFRPGKSYRVTIEEL